MRTKSGVASFFALLLLTANTYAQSKLTDGYQRTSRGLYYKIIVDGKKPKGKQGDLLKMNLEYLTQKDSVLFSTYQEEMGPVQFTISAPTFNGDPMEGFTLLGEGDSAIFLMQSDSAYKGQEMPPFAKPGEFVKIHVNVLSMMTQAEFEKKKAEETKVQSEKDVTIIESYLLSKGLKAQKTSSGLYYILEKQGDGARAESGKTVTVNYTGKFLDGKVFDSSLSPGHSPLEFKLGAGQMIKGFDEGINMLNVGGKATLIIPSSLAWGNRAQGAIPANAVVVFDVELMGVE
ncbi:MAG: FKBP-type peptidyl-prolyl cis-trans isomerase [Chitinophagales bacterium]